MIKRLIVNFISHWPLYTTIIVLSVLLFRNPYSTRNLIANLEPFPDAQYYTTTPRCFINGQGWKMCRINNSNISGIKSVVPPAYSLIILPGYLINFDVRTFYFTNVFLSLISLILLYKVSRNFFENNLIIGLILFIYTTNYFIYWYPSLAMAENLILPVFLLSIYLLQRKITSQNSILAGVVAATFYATKFAFAPLTLFFSLLYFIKVIKTKLSFKQKIIQTVIASISASIILAPVIGIEQLQNIFSEQKGVISEGGVTRSVSHGSSFSINFFNKHIKEYASSLLGQPQRFLWDFTPLTERWLALPGLFGLIINIRYQKLGLAKIWLVVATIAQLVFISFFYVVDIRYVYHFLPILILGFGFFLQHLQKTLLKTDLNFKSFMLVILIIYLAGNILRLKSATMLNLKYTESPWWYLSQLEMNRYFKSIEDTTNKQKKPILITLASPFLTDNYTNGLYTTLPLDPQQDFRNSKLGVWGFDNKSKNLIKYYQNRISLGYPIFITNYGISAASYFQETYGEIEANFIFEQVHSGCYNLCNIYKLNMYE